MPYSDKKNKNFNAQLYYEKNREKLRKCHNDWCYKNREKLRKYQNDWRHKNRKKFNSQKNLYNQFLKLETLTHYGPDGVLRCTFCEITDIDMLTLDHINDDGAQDKDASGKRRGGVALYQHVKALNFPEGFQTLCANHQLKKEILRRRASIV